MKVSNIEYFGAEIDFPQDLKNIWRIKYPESEGWKVHLSHCTLGHCSNMTVKNLLSAFMNQGEKCELVIDAFGQYELPDKKGEVVAFRVKNNKITVDGYPMKGENTVFHITAFTRGDARPVDSNKIVEWKLVGEMKLTGRIKFWMKEKER